ncbi:MAG: DUF6748 domain-containing protein [Myxococcaceae bacterium]
MKRLIGMMAVVGLVGCGTASVTGSDELGAKDSRLENGVSAYHLVRKDVNRCAAPRCGGYWLTPLNVEGAEELYVTVLYFGRTKLGLEGNDALEAADGELIVRGATPVVAAGEAQRAARTFEVEEVYRGLPGVRVAPGDFFAFTQFSGIQCITAPCPTLAAQQVNVERSDNFSDYQMSLNQAFLDESWLQFEAREQGAIVAGHFTAPGASENRLVVSQVFLPLPHLIRSCPIQQPLSCASDEVVTYQREPDRCMLQTACAKPGFCTQSIPACSPGYTLTRWAAGESACPAYRCDPSFILE